MSQVLRKQESPAQGRTLPPPLPRRQVVAAVPAAKSSRPVTRSSVTPPPPPLAALRSPRPVAPTAQPGLQLAIVPQWEDAAAPLQPVAKKQRGLAFWFGAGAVTLAAGALAAAGFMGVRLGDFSQFAARRAPVVHEVPVQYIVAEALEPVEIALAAQQGTEGTLAAPSAGEPQAVETLEPATDEIAAQPAVSAQPAAKRRPRRMRARPSAVVATPPDPSVEAAAREQAAPEQAPTPVLQIQPVAPALPDHLTREQVRAGLEALRPIVQACAAGAHGKALADISISADGRVALSVIEGDFAGTAAGSCMARTLRSAQFPAFAGPRLSVRYPFAL